MRFSYAKPIRLLQESRPQLYSTLIQYDKRKGEGGRGKEKGEGGRGKEKGEGGRGKEKRGRRKGERERGGRKGEKRNIERERERNVTRRTHARTLAPTQARTHAHTTCVGVKINTANKLFYLMLLLSGSKLALLLGRCNFDRLGKGISFVSCFIVVYIFKCYYLQW